MLNAYASVYTMDNMGSSGVNPSPSGMESQKSGNLSKHFWRFLAGFIILIIVAVILGLTIHNKLSKTSSTFISDTSPNYPVVINGYIYSHKYQQAINLIKSQKDVNSVDNQMLLAAVYSAEGDSKDAFNIYSNLEKEGKLTYNYAAEAAGVAFYAKEYSLSIQYYQLAIKLAPGHDPTVNEDVAYWKNQIADINTIVKIESQKKK